MTWQTRSSWLVRFRTPAILGMIMAMALALRLYGLSYGLPAIYDPDEPLFMILGYAMLSHQTLNPGWFGHPGTTTIYAMALIEILVLVTGLATGRFASIADFAHSVYLDPGLVAFPARLFIMLCGLLCIWLTFLVGRRLFNDRIALGAAALLAVNAVHITYSQIIRTDVHSTVFILLCVLASIQIARRGALRDYMIAGMWVGLACATKWPASLVAIAIVSATLWRCHTDRAGQAAYLRRMAASGAIAIATLLIVSPYLLLDFGTVMQNLRGEAQPHHLGSTGEGLLGNLRWYLFGPLWHGFGPIGLIFILIGGGIMTVRDRLAAAILLPVILLMLVVICAQGLRWERWIVPLLPFLALLLAFGFFSLIDRIREMRFGVVLTIMAGLTLLTPMLRPVLADSRERTNDTRAQASAWARAHIPRGATIAIEHYGFDLLGHGWTILMPAGRPGCLEAISQLTGKVDYSSVGSWRGSAAVVDLGTMDDAVRDSCRADYMILSHYDRYADERSLYPVETARYERFIAQGAVAATFRPMAGRTGGPVVRVIRMKRPEAVPIADAAKGRSVDNAGKLMQSRNPFYLHEVAKS